MSEGIQRLIQCQAGFIIDQQLPSGAIPWYRGGITDPWDHVECAIALGLSAHVSEASLAYKWMRNTQNPDGSWYFSYQDDKPQDLTRDTNFSTYIAAGMWLHYLTTRDLDFLRYMWPAIEKGISFALSLQQPGGEIYWGLSENNRIWPGAILTASSSTWLSIERGIRIAKALGLAKPDWDEACRRLAEAISEHPERFDRLGEDKSGHAMTWYYPILVGLMKGKRAEERISRGWQDFIIDGETFELVLALAKMGAMDKARTVRDWVLQFRDSDGVFYREAYWPQRELRPSEQEPQIPEKNTWTSAAAILALVASDEREMAIAQTLP
jgi:hypothetical protein